MKCLREKGQGPRIDQYFLRSQSSQSNEIQRQEANHSSQDISTPVIDVRRTCMDTVSDEPNDPCEPAMSSENLRTCFQIVNAYIFLSSSEFLQVVEIAIKVNPALGTHMFQSLLPSVFRGVIDGERYPVVMSTYLGVMGRVLLQNGSFFSSLLTQMAVEFHQEHGLGSPIHTKLVQQVVTISQM
ncbi:UNVERIFIED_CONTAM: hypothetical protein FKN15_028214 [Acipenser sinensis]